MSNWLLAIVVGGYLIFNNVKDNVLSNIKFRFGGIAFDGIGGDLQSIRFVVKLIVDNGSMTSIPLDAFDGVIFYKNRALAPIKQTRSADVKANSSTLVNYGVEVNRMMIESVFGSWQKALSNLKDASNTNNYRLKGQITFRLANIVYYQDIDQTF
jgi:LEA14-like dessication related protein